MGRSLPCPALRRLQASTTRRVPGAAAFFSTITTTTRLLTPMSSSSSSSSPTGARPRDRRRASSGERTGLSLLSQQVRRLVSTLADATSQPSDREDAERALLACLMAQRPAGTGTSGSAATGKGSAAALPPPLHPLLCVKILERLPFPLLPPSGVDLHQQQAMLPSEGRGWLSRHALLGSHDDFRRVFDIVLAPLEPLLGLPAGESTLTPGGGGAATATADAAPAMHPQVRPVLPYALAWWAMHPAPASTSLKAEVWLRHLVHEYAQEAHHLPPPTFLLPFVCDIVDGRIGAHRVCAPTTAGAEEKGGEESVIMGLFERFLVLALSPTAGQEGTAGVCITVPTEVQALFWESPAPLLARPWMGPALQRVCRSGGAPVHVRVDLADDDAFRRFLLRMMAAAQLQLPACHQRQQQRGSESDSSPCVCVEPHVVRHGSTLETEGAGARPPGESNNLLRWVNPLHDFIMTTYAGRTRGQSPSPVDHAHGTGEALAAGGTVQLSFVGLLNVLSAILDELQALRSRSSCNDKPGRGDADPAPLTMPDGTRFTLLEHSPRVHAMKRVCEELLHHTRRLLHAPPSPAGEAGERAWFTDVAVPQQEAVLRRMCGACRALVRVTMEEKRWSLITEGPEGSALSAGGVGRSQQQQQEGGPGDAAAPSSSPSLTAVSDALRNTAFRVLEPALGALYDLDACGRGEEVDLHPFADDAGESVELLPSVATVLWAAPYATLAGLYGGDTADAAGSTRQGGGAGTQDALHMREAPRDAAVLESVFLCLDEVLQRVGGASAWRTADEVLRHPLQQPPAAVLEGIRLVALRALLFDGQGEAPPDLGTLFAATHGVWGRCGGGDLEGSSGGGLRSRLLLLTLLVGHRAALCGGPATNTARACSSLLELTGTSDGGLGAEWDAVGLAPLLAELDDAAAAAVHVGATHTSGGLALGLLPRWELLDHLDSIAHSPTPTDGDDLDEVTTWRWLGSTGAIAAEASSLARGAAAGQPRLLLVPWSTLAAGHQPLRLYDESGQSTRAGRAAACALQSLLAHAQPPTTAVADGPGLPRAVVRFVPLLEEIAYFSPVITREPVFHLGPDVVVVNEELAVAQRIVEQAHASARATAQPDGDHDEDDEYDGLD